MSRRTFLQTSAVAGGAALLGMPSACSGKPSVETEAQTNTPQPTKNRIVAVPARSVRITDSFWSPKIAVWRQKTINDCLDKFEKTGALENFDRVAQKKTDGFHGEPWWDGLVYEMISGASGFLTITPDAALERRLDGYIDRIGAAAAVDPDGYINTAVNLKQVAPRWSNPPAPGDMHDDRYPHTLYNIGCLVEAGIHYQHATGKTKLLQIATRIANYMCELMGPSPKQNIVPGHALPEMAFLDLYQLYHEKPELRAPMGALGDGQAYADLALFWIDNRGNHTGRTSMEAYDQDDRPVQEQATLEGHAVRAVLLATGIARGAMMMDRTDYRTIGERWWQNMVEAKEYITGGLGAVHSFEGFGPDFELPNNGYCETCASVAGGQFDQEMFLATGQAKYIDALERSLYNGVLSGVSLAGDNYFYTNYLASGPETRRWDWHPCPCCPPMFLKLTGVLPSLFYATDNNGVYVNFYAGNDATMTIKGQRVRLEQKTEYPWEGKNVLIVHPEKPGAFQVRLRVPAWSENATVQVNGKTVPAKPGDNGYIALDRTWNPGDVVTLDLPMPIKRVHADPRVKANHGRVALMRGPMVYCLEEIDCGAPVSSVVLPPASTLHSEHRSTLLGGVTVITGSAQVVHAGESLTAKPRVTSTKFTAIPYYTNSNRTPTSMAVWLAEENSVAAPLTLTGQATVTASHVNASDTVNALNDAIVPRASDDESISRFTWWDHRGTSEWVQYEFSSPQHITGVSVYWWDERRVGRHCRVPLKWHVEYREGETWKPGGATWRPVTKPSAYGTEIDAFNRVTFDPVETSALRLVVELQKEWSGGILEWEVHTKK